MQQHYLEFYDFISDCKIDGAIAYFENPFANKDKSTKDLSLQESEVTVKLDTSLLQKDVSTRLDIAISMSEQLQETDK